MILCKGISSMEHVQNPPGRKTSSECEKCFGRVVTHSKTLSGELWGGCCRKAEQLGGAVSTKGAEEQNSHFCLPFEVFAAHLKGLLRPSAHCFAHSNEWRMPPCSALISYNRRKAL